MVAGWVQNDLDLVKWVATNVEAAGAYWTDQPSFAIGPVEVTGVGETTAVAFDCSNYVTFYDRSRLKIEFTAYSAPAGWQYTKYSYQYEKPATTFVFRYDKHYDPKFEHKHGTECHVHVGTDHSRDRLPTRVAELDDVLERVRQYQQTREFDFYV